MWSINCGIREQEREEGTTAGMASDMALQRWTVEFCTAGQSDDRFPSCWEMTTYLVRISISVGEGTGEGTIEIFAA